MEIGVVYIKNTFYINLRVKENTNKKGRRPKGVLTIDFEVFALTRERAKTEKASGRMTFGRTLTMIFRKH